MLINRVELHLLGHSPLRDTIKARAPHLEIWRKLFSRRCTQRSELLDVSDKGENVDEAVSSRTAVSDPSTNVITRLLPNLRCSP